MSGCIAEVDPETGGAVHMAYADPVLLCAEHTASLRRFLLTWQRPHAR